METTAFTTLEIQQFRTETKGSTGVIHFNNAGASLPPDCVVETVIDYLKEEAIYGGYETEAKYMPALENTYKMIARLINAETEEIAIVENASYGWALAFNGIGFKPGDVVLTCEMEYVTNLMGFLHLKKTLGIEIQVIPNDVEGNFQLTALENAITPQVKLIAVTHIPSTAGGMVPIVEIGRIARKYQILYLVDACQSAGQIPLDVKEIGCDMLSVTGRKYLRAPRGTGFLYVRQQVQDQLNTIFMDGHSAQWISENDYQLKNSARRFELYEKNRATTLGLGKAVEYAMHIGVDRIWQHVQFLAALMRRQLAGIDGITVHDFGAQQCGIVTFSVINMDSTIVKNKLAGYNINVTVGKAKSTLIYMNKNHLASIVRASVHYYNTEDEINRLCEVLMAITK